MHGYPDYELYPGRVTRAQFPYACTRMHVRTCTNMILVMYAIPGVV